MAGRQSPSRQTAPPRADTSPPVRQTPHSRQTLPRADTPLTGRQLPLGRHPPAGIHPPGRPPWDGHCSGWYASYWNAFLFHKCFCKNYSEVNLSQHSFPCSHTTCRKCIAGIYRSFTVQFVQRSMFYMRQTLREM